MLRLCFNIVEDLKFLALKSTDSELAGRLQSNSVGPLTHGCHLLQAWFVLQLCPNRRHSALPLFSAVSVLGVLSIIAQP